MHQPQAHLCVGETLLGGLREAGRGGCVVGLDAQAFLVDRTEQTAGARVFAGRAQAQQRARLLGVALDAVTEQVQHAAVGLGGREALLGRALEPCGGIRVRARDAAAFVQAQAEVVLGRRVTLCGSEGVPARSGGRVRRDAASFVVCQADQELRLRVAGLGQRSPERERSGVVAVAPGVPAPAFRALAGAERKDKDGQSEHGVQEGTAHGAPIGGCARAS